VRACLSPKKIPPIFVMKKATGALRFFYFRQGQKYNAHFRDKKTTCGLRYFLFKDDQKNNAIFCEKKGLVRASRFYVGSAFF
jgi:hypothetical protein